MIAGVVKGYERKFWQLSPDHRGTESAASLIFQLVIVTNLLQLLFSPVEL